MLDNTLSNNLRKKYQLISLVAYASTILISCLLLLIEPDGFDVRVMIMPLIALLLLSSIGIGYKFAIKNKPDAVSIIGAIMLAILFTFIGFFAVAAVAWFTGLAHAS